MADILHMSKRTYVNITLKLKVPVEDVDEFNRTLYLSHESGLGYVEECIVSEPFTETEFLEEVNLDGYMG